MPQKRMQCFRLLLDHLALIEHQFLSGRRDSRNPCLWGMMRGVGGVRKSIHQSWLAKELGLLCWGFKGVQEESETILGEKVRVTSRTGSMRKFVWEFEENKSRVRDTKREGLILELAGARWTCTLSGGRSSWGPNE